ncbi:MAG: putative negative regulator of RcsB-dependent stress response [Paraglaciecola sp.]|jgi:predicted negative regulator of RcsB-dependent stress response
MEKYETEEQQVEAIKRFWKENGVAIIVGAVLGLGGLYGWRYYNEQKVASQEYASAAYEKTTQELLKSETGFSEGQAYINENADTGYALLMAFKLAQQAVERKDLSEAAKHLNFAAANAHNEAIQAIANLRLARIQLELEQLAPALLSLDKVTDEAFSAQRQETKGDVYMAQKLFDKARAAYSSALQENANNDVLKMKLDNLATVANG